MILEELNIDTDKPFICSIASNAAVGKTTVAIMLAAELVNNGKHVLFISEDSVRSIRKKFINLITSNIGRLIIKREVAFSDGDAYDIIGESDSDYIFLDTPTKNTKQRLQELLNLKMSNDIKVFTTHGLKKETHGNQFPITPLSGIELVDYFIVLKNKTNFSFFEKIKYFFLTKPNKIFSVIKNRYGKLKTIDININFKKINS